MTKRLWRGLGLWMTGALGLSAVGAPPPLRSAVVIVRDQQTGKTLLQKAPDTVHPIASITKLMTAMVVLDAKADLEEHIRIEHVDVDTLRNSRSRLPVGTQLTRREALLLALMSSENRAAHALGRTFPGGTAACVAAMNTKARALGLASARFEDTSGLHSGNVASGNDLAKLVTVAHGYPQIRAFSTTPEATVPAGRTVRTFGNSNGLVHNRAWNIGLSKTGFIEEAGRCLVMQVRLASRPMVVVLLDSVGKYTRLGDAQRIKQWLEGVVPTRRRKRR